MISFYLVDLLVCNPVVPRECHSARRDRQLRVQPFQHRRRVDLGVAGAVHSRRPVRRGPGRQRSAHSGVARVAACTRAKAKSASTQARDAAATGGATNEPRRGGAGGRSGNGHSSRQRHEGMARLVPSVQHSLAGPRIHARRWQSAHWHQRSHLLRTVDLQGGRIR